jgi:hypothetical protein
LAGFFICQIYLFIYLFGVPLAGHSPTHLKPMKKLRPLLYAVAYFAALFCLALLAACRVQAVTTPAPMGIHEHGHDHRTRQVEPYILTGRRND